MQAIIQTGNLPDLRWPNFSDYGKHLQKFYDSYGYALPWVRGMEPSPQALQIIALIQQAEEKGLNPGRLRRAKMERPPRVAKALSRESHRNRRDEV